MGDVPQVFYSPRCPNCTRFLSAVGRVPSLASGGGARFVNVDASPEAARMVTAVPTVVTRDGAFVGSKAFEWLAQFQDQTELDSCPLTGCGGGLAWAALDGDSFAQFSDNFSPFEAPAD